MVSNQLMMGGNERMLAMPEINHIKKLRNIISLSSNYIIIAVNEKRAPTK